MMKLFDWNQMWKDYNDREVENSKPEFWDSFAAHFRKKAATEKDPYVELFYEYSHMKPGDTIFDMGCASGTLAIPYALKGHEIYAADFSKEMLKVLMKGAEEAGVEDRIHPIHLDWNEDWSKRDLPKCDVAISSRALIFEDLTSSLKKLESVTKNKVCLGVWDLPTRGYDRYLAKAIGYERAGYGTHFYVINELLERDMMPELRFIRSPFRPTKYETREAAINNLRASLQYGLTAEQEEAFESYCEEHLKFHSLEDGGEISARRDAQGKKEYWQMDHSHMATIAFIKYNANFDLGDM
ncbi:MAG: class I SAM-dependent methyltransferase [Bacillota bacterium]|nr:class I SAM-dependent methyltransferase [Bacillota bacterium]